jgi:hypothetical protein
MKARLILDFETINEPATFEDLRQHIESIAKGEMGKRVCQGYTFSVINALVIRSSNEQSPASVPTPNPSPTAP